MERRDCGLGNCCGGAHVDRLPPGRARYRESSLQPWLPWLPWQLLQPWLSATVYARGAKLQRANAIAHTWSAPAFVQNVGNRLLAPLYTYVCVCPAVWATCRGASHPRLLLYSFFFFFTTSSPHPALRVGRDVRASVARSGWAGELCVRCKIQAGLSGTDVLVETT